MTGLSVARCLRRLGVADVIVVDAGTPGQEATVRSSGGFRRQFATAIEINLSTLSLPFFDEVFASADFSGGMQRLGYAFLAGEGDIRSLSAAWVLQRKMGVPSEWLEPADIRARFPYLETDGLRGGTFSAEDGFVDPWSVHQWLLRDCRRSGVTILEDERVIAMDAIRGRIATVRTELRTFEPSIVINAGGAWSRLVSRLGGSDLEVDPSPRVKLVTNRHPQLPTDMPLITDMDTGVYVRSEGGAAMIGVKPPHRAISFEIDTSAELISWMAERATTRFPSLADAGLAHLVTGLYEVTPDGLPIAGRDNRVENLFVISGFNGHGIMHGPALARALAELIVLGRPTDLDLDALSPGRFAGISGATAHGHRDLL